MTWLFAALFVVMLGIWGWRNTQDHAAFFAASRRAGAILAGLGGTAAGLSAFVFIGGPGLFASIGIASLWIILSAPLTGVLQCWAIGEPIVDLTKAKGCLTIPELVAARYGPGVPQLFTALAILAGGIATLAVQLKGLSVLGNVLLGWSPLLLPAMVLAATLVYTALGGMRAGLWAEAAQGVIMALAALGVAGVALAAAGGPSAAIDLVAQRKPELLRAWPQGREMNGIAWMLLFFIGTCAQPHYVQKFLFLRNRAALRWMPVVMTVSLIAVLSVWVGVGLGGSALSLDGKISPSQPDDLAPAILRLLGGPAMSIAMLAIIAAVMSTTTSLLTLISAAVCRDIPSAIKPGFRSKGLTGARVSTIIVGALSFAVAMASGRQVALLGIMGWGLFCASLLPVLLLGLRWSGATRLGALIAIPTGAIVQISLELAPRIGSADLSAWEPGLTGASVGLIALAIVSWLRPEYTEPLTGEKIPGASKEPQIDQLGPSNYR